MKTIPIYSLSDMEEVRRLLRLIRDKGFPVVGRLLEPQVQTYEEVMAEFERLMAFAQKGARRQLSTRCAEWTKEDVAYCAFECDTKNNWYEVRVESLGPKKTIRLVVETMGDIEDRRLVSWHDIGNLTYEIINSPFITGVNVISDNDCICMVYDERLHVKYEAGERYETVWNLDVDRDENVTVHVEGEVSYGFSLKNV